MKGEEYFVSEAARLIYVLVYQEGGQRCEALGLTDEMYENKEAADTWYREIHAKIHPDRCKLPDSAKALKKLNDIYDVLVDTESFHEEEE